VALVRFSPLARRLSAVGLLAAVVLSGCGLQPVTGARSFEAANLAPPDAWGFIDLTMRPSVAQALYARDVLDLYNGVAAEGSADLHHVPTPSGRTVDLETDLLPRLDGEVAFFVHGPSFDPHASFVAHTNDLDATLRLILDESPSAFTKDARGAVRYEASRGQLLAAGYKGWVVVSDDRATLEQVLDRIDGKLGPTLASQARYQSVVDRLTGDRVGYGYLDLAQLVDRGSGSQARIAESVGARGRVAFSVAFGPGSEPGVRALDMRAEYAPDVPQPVATAASGDALSAMDRLPAGTALALAGPSIGQWLESVASLNEDEVPSEIERFLEAFAGPYAVGVTPAPGDLARSESDLLGGVFFIGQLADKIDPDALRDQGGEILDNADADATWQAQAVADDGWLALNVVPASVGPENVPQEMLASDRHYHWLRPAFDAAATNVYLDLTPVWSMARQSGQAADALSALEPVRVVGASSRSDAGGDTHTRMVVMLAGLTTP
jgi:hypothetical protein